MELESVIVEAPGPDGGLVRVDLLEGFGVGDIQVELTTSCNLRCVYCPKSAPDFQGAAMESDMIDQVEALIEELRPRRINLTADGETTTLPDWISKCRRLMKWPDIEYTIISNFAKRFADDELDLLSRFTSINVSLDTADETLLKDVRKAVDLRTLTANIMKVRARAVQDGRREPTFVLIAVLTDRTVGGLVELAAFAVACRIPHLVLSDLNERRNPGEEVSAVRRLDDAAFDAAMRRIEAAKKLMRAHGGDVVLIAGLEDALELRRRDGPAAGAGDAPPAPGMTRVCAMAWDYLGVQRDGTMLACCSADPTAASLLGRPGEQVLNGAEMRAVRKAVLDGDLWEGCRRCHMGRWGDPEELRRGVMQELIRRGKYKTICSE
jgi:MoaA/NifB/PqqE/SkfB family radical SAM enzyme